VNSDHQVGTNAVPHTRTSILGSSGLFADVVST
jgi:hypothetical protein